MGMFTDMSMDRSVDVCIDMCVNICADLIRDHVRPKRVVSKSPTRVHAQGSACVLAAPELHVDGQCLSIEREASQVQRGAEHALHACQRVCI